MENGTLASGACVLQAGFQYTLFTAIYSAVFVLGSLENGAALYLLTCRAADPPRSYVYLVNLAVVDTLFVGVLPFKIHYHLHHNDWVFGDLACRLTGSMFFLNIYLSIAFFTCICVDRYVAVLHPFAYVRVKGRHYGLVAAALWAAAAGITLPLVLGGPLDARVRNATACFESFAAAAWTGRLMPFNVCALVFGFAVPFAVILVSYPLIARRIRRIPRSARRRKALGTIGLILLICVTCFLPFHLTHLLHFLMRVGLIRNCRFAASIYRMRRVTMALVSLNCCLNPVLYYFTATSKRWRWPFRFRTKTVEVYAIRGEQDRQRPAAGTSRSGQRSAQRTGQAGAGVELLKMPKAFGAL
ncbi:lysophosphatidic acid receptor 6-like [Hemicordylus capensis]|uniref:lysophosphatidic acid receptor 6-like n=1 Tax=Hemicordylus capensis TaxID=884348 RepID=UPI0023032091|nr:lysophosphatidic acid receptor 6-like [Hemicordylus capensis]